MNKLRHFVLTLLVTVFALSGCTAIKPVLTADEAPFEKNIFSNTSFDKVLEGFVNQHGLVDYSSLREDPGDLESYYRLIATYSPDSHPDLFPNKDHKLAYWINAYNAAVIKTVLSYYPINSVLDVKQPVIFFFLSDKSGFFVFQRLTFGGKATSLYYLFSKQPFLDFSFGPFLIIFTNPLLVETSNQLSMLFGCLVTAGNCLVDNFPITCLHEFLK